MTRPLRICVTCGARYRTDGSRCRPCELAHQRARNAARPQYAGTWPAYSRARRKAQPWCSICGAVGDTTVDHDTDLVMCVHCNSSRRRNPE